MPGSKGVLATNRLLTALPRKDRQPMLANCEQVELAFADILFEAGAQIHYAYFPIDSFVALVAPIDSHAKLEVGLVGDEGMLGISLLLGVNVSPLRAQVQGPGLALRMKAIVFRDELKRRPSVQRLLNRYLYVSRSELAQTAACTHFHVVQARLARWLLMIHDRAHSDAFHLTHESIAVMLGVRRVGVTRAAGVLKEQRLIRYSRGAITIVDRIGLEAASCVCYRNDRTVYERILMQ